MLHRMRELWCAVTARCAIDPPHDPYLAWMAAQERASIAARHERRQQARQATGNMAEDTVFLHRPKGGPR